MSWLRRPTAASPTGILWLLMLACALAPAVGAAAPLTIIVNSPADIPDVNPGNSICETAAGNGTCTLRGAVQEANGHSGPDTIQLQAGVTYLLTRAGTDDTALSGDLDIRDSVTIVGAGAGTTVVDGNSAVVSDGVFQVSRCILGITSPSGCFLGDVVASISGITIQHGRRAVGQGGGVANAGNLVIDDCIITENTTDGGTNGGGGIYNQGTVELNHSVVSNNTANGIYNVGTLTVIASTISGNSQPATGGGLTQQGDAATIIDSTISGNSAGTGGGIFVGYAPLIMINSTISDNTTAGSGGGLHVVGAGSVAKLFNVTIANNRANLDATDGGDGGGVYNGAAATAVRFANSIIGNNTRLIASKNGPPVVDADDCAGLFTSLGNNLLTSVDMSHCAINGAYVLGAANIDPLADNGGPTRTQALLPGSPAIDGGNLGGCADDLGTVLGTDQRGVARPQGAACDIGAFEQLADELFADNFEPQS